jgi:hypothetical protein
MPPLLDQCPACGRALPSDAPSECPRCRADLAPSRAIRLSALRIGQQARRTLPRRPDDAAELLRQAWSLHPSPEIARLMASSLLLLKQYPQALRWRLRAGSANTPPATPGDSP